MSTGQVNRWRNGGGMCLGCLIREMDAWLCMMHTGMDGGE